MRVHLGSCNSDQDPGRVTELHRIVTSDHTLKVGDVLYREIKEVIQITSPNASLKIRIVHTRAIGDKIYQRTEDLKKRKPNIVKDSLNFPKKEIDKFEAQWKENFKSQGYYVQSRLTPWIEFTSEEKDRK